MVRDEAEVVIVGGGVIGCASAMVLAPDHDVRVLERDQVASGATALAAGEVTMSPSYTDYRKVAVHANEFFEAFDGTGQFDYHERQSLEFVPADRADAARRRVKRHGRSGIPVTYLDSEAVAEAFPRFDLDGYAGAVLHEETGFVDPYTLAMEYKNEAESNGAAVETGIEVIDLVVEDGAVRGVETAAGRIGADTVILAAGWQTEPLLRDHLQIPIRPYRTQCVVLEPDERVGESFPMGWIPGQHVYFKPEPNGDLLVGGWSFAEEDPPGASDQADPEFKLHVADLVPSIMDSMDGAGFVDGWAGIDAATPDTRPIIDTPADGPDGLVIATGFHGRGIMTSPVAATLVRALVTGSESDIPQAPFELDRFESRSTEFHFTSISAGADESD